MGTGTEASNSSAKIGPLSGFAFPNIAADSISWETCSAFKHETSAILTLIFVFVSRGIQLSLNVKGALSAFLEHIAIKGKLQKDGSVLFTIIQSL